MKYRYLLSFLFLSCLWHTQAYAFFDGPADRIYSAARRGDIATLNYYVNSGYYIDTPNGDGETALCMAYYDKSWQAYDLLLRYGANPNSNCMYKKKSNVGKYVVGGLVVAGIAGGVAIAASSGGGGGGGSSHSGNNDNSQSANSNTGDNTGNGNDNTGNNGNDNTGNNGNDNTGNNGNDNSGNNGNDNSGNNGNDNSGNNGNDNNGNNGNDNNGNDDSGNNNTNTNINYDDGTREGNLKSRMANYINSIGYTVDNTSSFHYYTKDDFRNNREYNGKYFTEHKTNGITYKSVNFHDGIQAAEAYSKFYGYDENDNLVSRLGKTVTVGIIDTGVNPAHKEFVDNSNASGTKVFGHNFDYGPCRGEKKSCWYISSSCIGSWCYAQKRELYDENGKRIVVDSRTDFFNKGNGAFDKWAAMYPSDYVWEDVKDDPTPLSGKDPLTNSSYAHGTHIAGIIAANWDRSQSGIMGVAFTNTMIDAVRWDFASSIDAPIEALVDDNVVAINMSLGRTASSGSNASLVKQNKDDLFTGILSAAAYTINSYLRLSYQSFNAYKGTIWVKAAGNDGYEEPDIESGIKNLGVQTIGGRAVDFSKLMMLVVVSADVTLDAEGKVTSYKKSSFSNACGSTARYCIAAPGGETDDSSRSDIYSTADSGYLGMHGTSQATPVVTGSIAYLQAAYPFLNSSEIIEILLETANTNGEGYNHNTEHYDAVYGAGLLDLGKAVTYYLSPIVGTNSVVTVSGDTVSSSFVRLDNSSLTVTAVLADALENALPENVTAFDRYMRPFEFPTADYIKVTHSGYKALKSDVNHIVPNQKIQRQTQGNMRFSYAEGPLNGNGMGFADTDYVFENSSVGFFFSENTKYNNTAGVSAEQANPFMAFNTAYGAHYGRSIGTKWNVKFEAVSGHNGMYDGDFDYNDSTFKKQAYGFNSEIEFRPSTNWLLAFSSGMLHEEDALLGMNGEGALGLPESKTYHTGIRAAWKASPKVTLSGSYFAGFTKAQKFDSSLLRTSDLISDSFAFDANYKYDKTTDFGFRLSSPLRVEHGKLYVDFAAGRDYYSDEVYRNRYASDLKAEKREYKLALYLNKELADNLSVNSEINVRFNPEHRADSNDYRALFGLSWNF